MFSSASIKSFSSSPWSISIFPIPEKLTESKSLTSNSLDIILPEPFTASPLKFIQELSSRLAVIKTARTDIIVIVFFPFYQPPI